VSLRPFRIAQLSDLHCGSPYFDAKLAFAAVDDILSMEPDLVVVCGDLTSEGYVQEFKEAKRFLEPLERLRLVVLPGNHDAKNVGYLHFRDIFGVADSQGKADTSIVIEADYGGPDGGEPRLVRLVAVDSAKPDLAEGEVGRERYPWLEAEFSKPADLKVMALHHHLVPVPGTGRERNTVWDAGDVLQLLVDHNVDMVLSGHKHVPHIWLLQGVLLVNSGTVSSWRLRGYSRPCYNVIEVSDQSIRVTLRYPGGGEREMGELDRQNKALKTNPELAGMFSKSAWRA
jgi:Icc protein